MSRSQERGGGDVVVGGAVHRVHGAQAAIVDGGRLLLQLRPWPPGWELPGGHVDTGEDPADCATREAEEETGLVVRVVALVGVYRWAGLRRKADAVYLVQPTGGAVRRSVESLRVRWVTLETLPRATFPWCRQRVEDALAVAAGAMPVTRTQPVTLPHVLFFGSAWLASAVDALHRRRTRASRR